MYNTCILPIFLYGSDCWAISKTDARKIDALDQWCLRMLLGINGTDLYGMMYGAEANEATQTHCYNPVAPAYPIWAIMRMDDNADAKRILLASPPADWRRQLGRPRITWLSTIQQDLKHHHLNYAPRSSRFGSEPPSAEDDVDVWRYAIPSCMSETTTTTTE